MTSESLNCIQKLDAATLASLSAWVGKSETVVDTITAAPMHGLNATLDRDDGLPLAGTPLPPLWHWLYFLPRPLQREIGPDGHPRRGGFLPPVPLPRRMWAGGRLQWRAENPLLVGDSVRRVSTIQSVTHKTGRSGDLVFVLVTHEIYNAKGLSLTEEQDIVYRAAALPGDSQPTPMPAEKDAAWRMTIVPDEVLLFRYSALTFNGHRIHYDRHYTSASEGYPGLVVHGPLIATMLAELARSHAPAAVFQRFSFKAVRPLFDLHPFQLKGQLARDGTSARLWAQDHEGWLGMQATVELTGIV